MQRKRAYKCMLLEILEEKEKADYSNM